MCANWNCHEKATMCSIRTVYKIDLYLWIWTSSVFSSNDHYWRSRSTSATDFSQLPLNGSCHRRNVILNEMYFSFWIQTDARPTMNTLLMIKLQRWRRKMFTKFQNSSCNCVITWIDDVCDFRPKFGNWFPFSVKSWSKIATSYNAILSKWLFIIIPPMRCRKGQ